ncbi:MAG: GNAT family N-acetyltransferase [Burkholderiales bacterium]|nr:GNAT family N-acetyltransferase [Burkholderiales bacterium]
MQDLAQAATAGTTTGTTIRALAALDLDAVVAIDAVHEGRARRAYFERRLAAALKQPALHVQLAAADERGLAGWMMARRTGGEFGRPQPGLRLESLGVRPDRQGQGVARQLLQALTAWAERHGVAELRTTATWTDLGMLRWLAASGFRLAPAQVLDCAVSEGWQAERGDALDLPADGAPGREIDYGAPEGNDFERSGRGRAEVRPMQPADLPQIVRIDRQLTGRDRREYIAEKLGEAMDDSGIRISLSARVGDAIVGFLMARADIGDFGRTEPVAVLDTIGVDPACEHQGIGHALVSQLFANLTALQIDRVETVVGPSNLALTGFLHDTGFRPSQRLSFVRECARVG